MPRSIVLIPVSLWMFALAGCNQPRSDTGDGPRSWFPPAIQGHWVLTDVDPPENVSAFTMQALTFNPDQTYLIRVVKDGNRLETQRGTYRFDEWNRRLYLHAGGEQRSYGAVVWFGGRLRLDGQTPTNQAATATYVRSNLPVRPDPAPADRRPR